MAEEILFNFWCLQIWLGLNFQKKTWKWLEMLIQKSYLSVEIWLPHLYFISNPNWMRKETLDLNFISIACALQSSTTVDRDIPAVHQVRGEWTCPSARLKPLPERCDELQDCASWEKTLLQCWAWYWGRRKLQQGCTNAPKIITELTSEKKTIILCKPLCFFAFWGWSVEGEGWTKWLLYHMHLSWIKLFVVCCCCRSS